MSIDLSQFFDVFFEESFEGLDAMEAELLNLEPGKEDSETINTIFRAAHSIKGGSGTFGFVSVSDFTHVLETLLDQIRDGQRVLTAEHVNLLLKSVDCVRGLLGALQAEEEPDLSEANELKARFEAILGGETSESVDVEEEHVASEVQQSTTYQIDFKPEPHLFKTGNEPLYMFSELAELGQLEVSAFHDGIPDFLEFDPEDCFLHWRFFLTTVKPEHAISEIFEWVEDDADIKIEACGGLFEDDTIGTPEVATQSEESGPLAAEQSASENQVDTSVQAEANLTAVQKKVESVKTSKTESKKSSDSTATSIRVGIDKVDSLINMVGELVITQAMLSQIGDQEITESSIAALQEGLAQLAHNTRDLQENVMRIRMLPISFVFSRFPRLVRDTSQKLNKQVELKLVGEQTELDKTVMEKLSDPMVHLVRNSLDHGLETPEERIANGKEPVGIVTLNAFHQGGNIVIEIMDDGKGLDTEKIRSKAIANGLISESDDLSVEEINELIFMPGFSTADSVSDISGRGVGMDVVRRNIQALNGSVEVTSKQGVGSTFTIRLPLTLAILDGQLVQVATHTYIIPLISIVESLQIDISKVSKVGKGLEVLRLRDEYIPILRLYDIFSHKGAREELDKTLLVVVESDNYKIGLLVDDLLAQQQVVIKSLEANYQKVDGISGATILGDGTVSLIIDISGLIKLSGLRRPGSTELLVDLKGEEAEPA
ncbi:chemotaxis protein CheA [Pseudoalteromonas luteoviolacea]|uniref:Chemotaxis protein CheA n=1 Tax=Pseudoalteromonas luteoviolacea S4054 TaxID=1129367 RepID=A0A0F6ACB5_9GAMM|nr:chemotaxis protein CheA [Pseudoalteromonas luteoviolacea]AOT06722.1 chemotaxis protein CheA [Pseudoalteromonas luteoviolacea]AOT11640.1 chemotaxis protein CheA [Pseudoalteromonas luteoviolacea]AOT16552.1 chemotaxis protein CheA [Pseudoalteromonas luteoviolacea]KKE83810.1 chemotaxis protein [Pseudoalteromonas luteoviolacea S4054]KZN73907.1 chemotaxis protein [Pseudoalteromonas luteoviolacea S4047-1]